MSKDTFHAALNETLIKEFRNTETGIKTFKLFLEQQECDPAGTLIGIESTGIYHLLFCARMSAVGFQVKVINPLLTSQMIASGLRMVKTDRKDAAIIRQAVLLGKGYLFTDTPEILALKALTSEREDLVAMRASLKLRMRVHAFRQQAAGICFYDSYKKTFRALSKEIKTIEGQMAELAPHTQSLLRSIPGIGKTAAAMLVAYVGDISRFKGPEQLVAYIGNDPRVKQSGTSIHGKGCITKRGSTLLRHVLYMAAFTAKRKNPAFTRYYEKKQQEGKHHTSILCALERKLIHLVWAVWNRGTPYEP